jgi:hypothetical protein
MTLKKCFIILLSLQENVVFFYTKGHKLMTQILWFHPLKICTICDVYYGIYYIKLQFDINLWHLLCFKVSFQIQF